MDKKPWMAPPLSLFAPLPLQITDKPNTIATKAVRITTNNDQRSKKAIADDVVTDYLIGALDMAMIYISPNPYGGAFKKALDLHKFNIFKHHTAGLCFFDKNNHILLASMAPSTPGVCIPQWQTCI